MYILLGWFIVTGLLTVLLRESHIDPLSSARFYLRASSQNAVSDQMSLISWGPIQSSLMWANTDGRDTSDQDLLIDAGDAYTSTGAIDPTERALDVDTSYGPDAVTDDCEYIEHHEDGLSETQNSYQSTEHDVDARDLQTVPEVEYSPDVEEKGAVFGALALPTLSAGNDIMLVRNTNETKSHGDGNTPIVDTLHERASVNRTNAATDISNISVTTDGMFRQQRGAQPCTSVTPITEVVHASMLAEVFWVITTVIFLHLLHAS